jgi:hypothetical protein
VAGCEYSRIFQDRKDRSNAPFRVGNRVYCDLQRTRGECRAEETFKLPPTLPLGGEVAAMWRSAGLDWDVAGRDHAVQAGDVADRTRLGRGRPGPHGASWWVEVEASS